MDRTFSGDGRIPATVRQQLLACFGITQICEAPVSEGLSGAAIYRVASASEQYCLRRWPAQTSEARLQQVHHLMLCSRSERCPWVPQLFAIVQNQTWMRAAGYLWELSHWFPGRALEAEQVSEKTVQHAFQGLADFHRSVQSLYVTQQPAPAIAARIKRIAEIQQSKLCEQASAWLASSACAGPLDALARRTIQLWQTHHAGVLSELQNLASTPTACQWVLRDVHREHLLWRETSNGEHALVGIVDYDAVRIDSPATDLARFWGSLGECPEQWLTSAIDSYRQTHRLDPHAAAIIPSLDKATCLIAALNWMDWLCIERRAFNGKQNTAIKRYHTVLERAERLL